MIRVTCAIIRNEDDELLVVQRGEESDHPLKWEFPGGKVQAGESEEECIIREIREELSMEIVIRGKLGNVDYDYGKKHILLIPFVCDTLDELPMLTEHVDFKWVSASELAGIDFSEADIIAAGNYLADLKLDDPEKQPTAPEEIGPAEEEDLKTMVLNIMGMKNAEWVAASAVENRDVFRKLLEFSYSGDAKLAFRASWILTKACDRFPDLADPFITGIIESLPEIDNESSERSFLRIISLSDLTKTGTRHHGLLADHCFNRLKSGFSAIAIKAYSMEILCKLAIIYPELTGELTATINMINGEASAGILARGRIILKKLAGFQDKRKERK